MNKREFIRVLSKRLPAKSKWPEERVAKLSDKIFREIVEAVRQNRSVEIRGFGTFFAQPHQTRHLRNPHSGELIEVPAKRIPRFKAGKQLSEKANDSD